MDIRFTLLPLRRYLDHNSRIDLIKKLSGNEFYNLKPPSFDERSLRY